MTGTFKFKAAALVAGLLVALFPSAPLAHTAESDIRRDAAVAAIEQVLPSVVNIATEEIIEYHDPYDNMLRQFFGWPGDRTRQERALSLGSGVIINDDGYILTNNHVVRRANRIQVKLWDGREYDAERVNGAETRDVALLRIKAKPGEKFKAVKFAPDDDLLLGETVLALGNPFGLGGSVSKGILSSKTRRPATGEEQLGVEDWLQTDAAINPGNSGGPLINLRAELIGLNVANVPGGPGIGFAIPIKQVNEALTGFFTPEATESLWLGVRLKMSGPAVVLSLVQPGSPAEKAGLRTGDQVLQLNGHVVHGLFAFQRLVSQSPQHEVAFVVGRGAEQHSYKVRMVSFPDLIQQKLGAKLSVVSAETAARFAGKAGQGLYIEEVEANGPAGLAQVQPGYLLTAIDDQDAGDLKAVANLLSNKKRGEKVQLTVVVPRHIGGNFIEFRQGTVEVKVR